MDYQWRALKVDGRRFDSIRGRVEALGIAICAPVRVAFKKRTDRPGFNRVEEQLFPDYMLLKFDPEVVHTTKITAIPGTFGFVAFGGQLPAIIPQWQIDRLQTAVKEYNDKLDNKGPVTIGGDSSPQAFRIIVKGNTAADRQGPFFALLQQEDLRTLGAVTSSMSVQTKPTRMVISF